MKKAHLSRMVAIRILSALIIVWCIADSPSATALERAVKTDVPGNVYEFQSNSEYPVSDAESCFTTAEGADTYGHMYISGEVKDDSKTEKSVPTYCISGDTLDIHYDYSDDLLVFDEDSLHLYSDTAKMIDGRKLPEKIGKGLVLVQISKDQKTWTDVVCETDAFSKTPIQTKPIYSATTLQLMNGCYYRVLIAYETQRKTDPQKILFVEIDNYELIRHAEIYEFYACNESASATDFIAGTKYSLGEKTRTEKYEGYTGSKVIAKDDVHYGWDLGQFFISGQTSTAADIQGNTVILKNVGDSVTLWFGLMQNLDALNGKKDLSISADSEWYDQDFETERTNSGRGVLIIQMKDYENVKHEPIIYTNFLAADAAVGVDTKVQLFEEGDYEAALDYEITQDKLLDQKSHYRIAFSFAVRNGNCMVYPFDVVTNEELTNSSMTENGFRLDMAKSRYLDIAVKKEVMTDSADGLTEDTRVNQVSRDGAEFVSEGIYTITVSNKYTGQITTKKIYVGNNSILRAYMTTGLSVSEINDLLSQGVLR